MLAVAVRPVAKRRFNSQRKGNEVPVAARVRRKKNNQRGPTVGRDEVSNNTKPNHPLRASTLAAIIKLR
jgi:hypothetical protein